MTNIFKNFITQFKKLTQINPKRLNNADEFKTATKKCFEAFSQTAYFKSLSKPEQEQQIKNLFTEDAKQLIKDEKPELNHTKRSMKDILCHFYGIDDNWKLGRCIVGAFLVHLPDYPSYVLPSYNQAKATGDAHNIKKSEGLRGIITGALGGIAVGASVSGAKIKARTILPYIMLGSCLQLISASVYPWVGEKLGQIQYNSVKLATKSDMINDIVNLSEKLTGSMNQQTTSPFSTSSNQINNTNMAYANNRTSSIKI